MSGTFGFVKFDVIDGVNVAIKTPQGKDKKLHLAEQLNEFNLRKYLPSSFNRCIGVLDKYKIYYIRMEKDAHDSLNDICNDRFCDEVDMMNYFTQCVNCLYDLHSKFISHNDIKSDNIMIKNNVVKLIDAGACEIRSLMPHFNNACYTGCSNMMRTYRGRKDYCRFEFNSFTLDGEKYYVDINYINMNNDMFALGNMFINSIYMNVSKKKTFAKYIVCFGNLYRCEKYDGKNGERIDNFQIVPQNIVDKMLDFSVIPYCLAIINVDSNISAKKIRKLLHNNEYIEYKKENIVYKEQVPCLSLEKSMKTLEDENFSFILNYIERNHVLYTDDEIFSLQRYLDGEDIDIGDLEYYPELSNYINDDYIIIQNECHHTFNDFMTIFNDFHNIFSLNTVLNMFLYNNFRDNKCHYNDIIDQFALSFYITAIDKKRIIKGMFDDDITLINFMNHISYDSITDRLNGMSLEESKDKIIRIIYKIVNIIIDSKNCMYNIQKIISSVRR